MRATQKFIYLCTGKDCQKGGSKKLLKSLPKTLTGKSPKSRVRIVKTKCLDLCKKGPNMIYDDRVYSNVNENLLNDVITECFRERR